MSSLWFDRFAGIARETEVNLEFKLRCYTTFTYVLTRGTILVSEIKGKGLRSSHILPEHMLSSNSGILPQTLDTRELALPEMDNLLPFLGGFYQAQRLAVLKHLQVVWLPQPSVQKGFVLLPRRFRLMIRGAPRASVRSFLEQNGVILHLAEFRTPGEVGLHQGVFARVDDAPESAHGDGVVVLWCLGLCVSAEVEEPHISELLTQF